MSTTYDDVIKVKDRSATHVQSGDNKGHLKKGHPGFGPSKYTKEFVTTELKNMLTELEESDYIYLGQLFDHRDYSSKKFPMWKIWYKDDEEVLHLHEMVSSRLETRKVVGAMRKDLDGRMVRAVLAMQDPDWVTKTKEEVTHKFDGNVVTDEKARILADLSGENK